MPARWPFQVLGDPNRPPLIFLHGFLGNRHDWLPAARAFDSDHFCILPDLPGHGRDNPIRSTRPLTFKSLVEDLASLISSLQIPRPVLIGYSLGGRAALNYACEYPERLQGLVLESTSPGLPSETARDERARLDDARALSILNDGLPAFLQAWYSAGLWSSLANYPDKRAGLIQERLSGHPESLARVVAELSPGRMPSLWKHLPHLQLPTFLLTGALDQKYNEITRNACARIPDCRLTVIENAGHNIHLERPETFIAELKRFLSEIAF